MSSFKDRIYNYEATPPANAWEKIAAAIDESQLNESFPSTLREMEVSPPAAAWDRIQSAIQPETAVESTPQQPAKIRRFPILRYVAAAMLIGAIAYGILQWSGRTSDEETNISNLSKAVAAPDTSKDASSPASASPNISTSLAEAEAQPETAQTIPDQNKKLVLRENRRVKTNTNQESVNVQSTATNTLYTYEDHVPSIADRYIMLMTPDGNFIRVSKKWSNMVCCVSGEEQDADCKDQLKKWQEKLAQSGISSGNFMDILTLVNSLDEGTDL